MTTNNKRTFANETNWLLVLALLTCSIAHADGKQQAPAVPDSIMLRTALVVSDIEMSKRFYSHALGYEILFDGDITKPEVIEQLQLSEKQTAHFVVLRGAKSVKGRELGGAMIGLLQVDNPPLPAMRRPENVTMASGEAMLAIVTSDIALVHSRMQDFGVKVLLPPTKYADGKESEMVAYDPDGMRIHVVERHTD